jgi:hypothetical protein
MSDDDLDNGVFVTDCERGFDGVEDPTLRRPLLVVNRFMLKVLVDPYFTTVSKTNTL